MRLPHVAMLHQRRLRSRVWSTNILLQPGEETPAVVESEAGGKMVVVHA